VETFGAESEYNIHPEGFEGEFNFRPFPNVGVSFYREVESGGSGSAYFVGKDLSTIPRIILSALHFTTFYMILATPVASFGTLLGLNIIYFYCKFIFPATEYLVIIALSDRCLRSLITCVISRSSRKFFASYTALMLHRGDLRRLRSTILTGQKLASRVVLGPQSWSKL